jgi:hypothetical protein
MVPEHTYAGEAHMRSVHSGANGVVLCAEQECGLH